MSSSGTSRAHSGSSKLRWRSTGDYGDDHRVLVAMDNIAWMRDELGDVSGARALTEEVLRRARAAGNLRMQASSLSTLGVYALREDRVAEALPLLEESYRISRDLDDSEAYFVLYCFAWALAIAGRAADATRVYSVAEAFQQETGRSAAGPFLERENEWTLARIQAQLDEGAFARAWDEGTRMTRDEAVALALARRRSRRAGPHPLTASDGVGCRSWVPVTSYFVSRGSAGECGSVDLAWVDKDVRVAVWPVTARDRCPTSSPNSAHETPCRCIREILRWRPIDVQTPDREVTETTGVTNLRTRRTA